MSGTKRAENMQASFWQLRGSRVTDQRRPTSRDKSLRLIIGILIHNSQTGNLLRNDTPLIADLTIYYMLSGWNVSRDQITDKSFMYRSYAFFGKRRDFRKMFTHPTCLTPDAGCSMVCVSSSHPQWVPQPVHITKALHAPVHRDDKFGFFFNDIWSRTQ